MVASKRGKIVPHPLVLQLRFTRSEFQRGLKGVTAEEGLRRLEPINSIGWMVGHLAWQEQRYWLTQAQGLTPVPEVNKFGYGQPASTPPLKEMWAAWKAVTEAADPWLDTLDDAQLLTFSVFGQPPKTSPESIGTRLLRTTYHYWFHTGESQAIRQLLGHTKLPTFVGDINDKAPYISNE